MSVLVYTEINKGRVKKASLECINYAAKIAETELMRLQGVLVK